MIGPRFQSTKTPERLDVYDTVEGIRDFLEHAPPDNGQRASGLAGFVTHLGYKVCDVCANRFGQRGTLPRGWRPIWNDSQPHCDQSCDICGKGGAA